MKNKTMSEEYEDEEGLTAEELMQGAKKPILLLPRQDGGKVAPAVAPDATSFTDHS